MKPIRILFLIALLLLISISSVSATTTTHNYSAPSMGGSEHYDSNHFHVVVNGNTTDTWGTFSAVFDTPIGFWWNGYDAPVDDSITIECPGGTFISGVLSTEKTGTYTTTMEIVFDSSPNFNASDYCQVQGYTGGSYQFYGGFND